MQNSTWPCRQISKAMGITSHPSLYGWDTSPYISVLHSWKCLKGFSVLGEWEADAFNSVILLFLTLLKNSGFKYWRLNCWEPPLRTTAISEASYSGHKMNSKACFLTQRPNSCFWEAIILSLCWLSCMALKRYGTSVLKAIQTHPSWIRLIPLQSFLR